MALGDLRVGGPMTQTKRRAGGGTGGGEAGWGSGGERWAYAGSVGVANRVVAGLLSSPFHRVLSRSTALIRYSGRRSGRTIVLPVQYAELDDGLVVLVGSPDTKQWWRNFRGGRELDALVRSEWRPFVGTLRRGTDEPDEVARLLDAYVARFPKVAHRLPVDFDERARTAVVVHCTPR